MPGDPPNPQDYDQLARDIGQVIGETRRRLGLTQAELAQRMGVDTQRLSTIELGKTNLTLRTMVSVTTALGIQVVDLFDTPKDQPAVPRRGRPKGASRKPKAR